MIFLKSIPRIPRIPWLSGKVLIMGDFNIHFKTLNHHNSRKMHDIRNISLSQSVTEPSHKHGHLLDLVFHRHNECLLRSTCLDYGLKSDHIAVLYRLDITKPAVQPVTTQFRSISKIYKNSFKQDLAQSITLLTPITDFKRQLHRVLDKHTPLCHRTVCQRKPTPWFSSIAEQFCKLKRERRRAERCWLKSKLTVHKQIYENIKRKFTDLVNNAKTAFYSYKIQTSNSCKELFHNFSAILGKKNSTPLPSSLDSDDIPQAFSEYFTNKFITIRNGFPPLNPTVVMDKSGKLLQTFTPVTEQFVSEILQKTVPKSCDLDPIPTELLYENLDVLLPIITNIINISLASGFVPPDFKTAVVKSLLKKTSPDQNVLKNYRPISNLPLLSKILEKVVLRKHLAHLQENNLCNPFQSAYRAGHSTETALLRVVNDLLNAMDEDKISVLLLLDLSAAFDTIDHQILLSRLGTVFGIRSTALRWFRSYLLDRNQCVVVNNSASSSSPVMFGVPQGSVLGPVLFVLYTTPLSDIIANHSVNYQLFANDTQLQKSTSPNDVQSLTHDLQSCTDDIKAWMCNNQLKLNEDKTEAILFSTPSLSWCHCLPSSIMVGTHEILFSDKVRNLRFIFDSNPSMKQHVIKICQTAYYELKHISSIRRYLTEDAAKQLVTSCVLSRLDYCNSLLMGTPNSVIQPMQKVQNTASRLILRAPGHQNCTPLLQQLHWLQISERIKYKTACMYYNAITGSAPSYLSELLHLYSPSRVLLSSSDTRMLKIQRFNRKTYGFRTFSHFGPHIWNNLPQDIRLLSLPSKTN